MVSTSFAPANLLDGPVPYGGTQISVRDDACGSMHTRPDRQMGDKAQTLKLVREAAAGFVATADLPTSSPDAKVVLVSRDPRMWWNSIAALSGYTAVVVRPLNPKGQLLEMQLSEGWEPLMNDAAATDSHTKKVLIKVFQVWPGIISATGVAVKARSLHISDSERN
ncbi:hypothetical protein GGR53DRAFT_523198 [Hypoxylon sp. FL1150]|nr:hypothetical protein GGR53DRAFT_523198 [Hypoxylon sp. FL1150]